jgi:hypothetical protein
MLAHTLAAILARPVSSLMVLLAVVAVGLVSFRGLPSQLTPEVEYPRLTVALAWRSAPPEAVESTITAPLEGELSKLAGLKTLLSVSSEFSLQSGYLMPHIFFPHLHFSPKNPFVSFLGIFMSFLPLFVSWGLQGMKQNHIFAT